MATSGGQIGQRRNRALLPGTEDDAGQVAFVGTARLAHGLPLGPLACQVGDRLRFAARLGTRDALGYARCVRRWR